jgi:hypothetical protein
MCVAAPRIFDVRERSSGERVAVPVSQDRPRPSRQALQHVRRSAPHFRRAGTPGVLFVLFFMNECFLVIIGGEAYFT